MSEGTKRNPAPHEIAALASEILTRARSSELPWQDLRALAGRDKATDMHRHAVKRLVADGTLLDLGEQGRQPRYTAARGSAHDTLIRLGCDMLRKRARGRFALFAATASAFKGDRSVPSRLRGAFPEALKVLVSTGEAFVVKAGRGASYFLLRSDVEAALRSQPLASGASYAQVEVEELVHVRSR
jgi:hypothetical protein